MKTYRSLTQEEIQQLKERSCTAVDWAEIEVVENFKTDYICHTRFSGRVQELIVLLYGAIIAEL